jgi:DNA gyrase subunit A
MAQLAMEMVRDIDENTVDFQDNYDGRTKEPSILPSRFPNLLVNGSVGIAVGMATNIPPHNLREVSEAALWHLANPTATREELLDAILERVKGPDFPTGALIVGTSGIDEAYRTGHGSITMRAVVETEEIHGRTCLVITELPYQVNPDNLAMKIADLVKENKLQGIADIRDESSGRTGQRLVIVLKRDAVAKVVLNNLYRQTQLQDNFGANMLAIVDGVPRTLPIDQFITYWVEHQISVIVRRTQFRLDKAEADAHILRGYLKALDALDAVIALIRKSPTVEDAKDGLIKLLTIDEIQAMAILNLQLRRLAALERQKIMDQAAEIELQIAEFKRILADEAVQRDIISTELSEIVDKYGDDRRTAIIPGEGDLRNEDLIPEEEIVITVTRAGYIKRTRSDNYRSQNRGGKGIKGAKLRADDVVQHFLVTTTHHWLLFFTDKGRVYRAKGYDIMEAARDAKGQHIANLLALLPGESVAQILDVRNYAAAEYLVLATRRGLVKKSKLADYDTNRSGGVFAIDLAVEKGKDGKPILTEDAQPTYLDDVVSAMLVNSDSEILLVSKAGMSLRFAANDASLRPTGRKTAGVKGLSLRSGDELLSAAVVSDKGYVFVVTESGFAKRTEVGQYRVQNRGGIGIKVAKLTDERGGLTGGLIVDDGDEVLVIMEGGKVVRSSVDGVPAKGRDTMGVVFARPDEGDRILAIARNVERNLDSSTENETDPVPDSETTETEETTHE